MRRWRAFSKASKSKQCTTKNAKHMNMRCAPPTDTLSDATIQNNCLHRLIKSVQLSLNNVWCRNKQGLEICLCGWIPRERPGNFTCLLTLIHCQLFLGNCTGTASQTKRCWRVQTLQHLLIKQCHTGMATRQKGRKQRVASQWLQP